MAMVLAMQAMLKPRSDAAGICVCVRVYVCDCGCCILRRAGKRPLGSDRWTKVVSGMDNNARPRANKRSLDGGTTNPCPAGGEVLPQICAATTPIGEQGTLSWWVATNQSWSPAFVSSTQELSHTRSSEWLGRNLGEPRRPRLGWTRTDLNDTWTSRAQATNTATSAISPWKQCVLPSLPSCRAVAE